jgi:hypothetical protein
VESKNERSQTLWILVDSIPKCQGNTEAAETRAAGKDESREGEEIATY